MRCRCARSWPDRRRSSGSVWCFSGSSRASGSFSPPPASTASWRTPLRRCGARCGIRLALGARPRSLLAQVLRTGFAMAAIGATIGLVAAWMLDDVFAAPVVSDAAARRADVCLCRRCSCLRRRSSPATSRPAAPAASIRSRRCASSWCGLQVVRRERNSRDRRDREDEGRRSQRAHHEGTKSNGDARRLSRCTTVQQHFGYGTNRHSST